MVKIRQANSARFEMLFRYINREITLQLFSLESSRLKERMVVCSFGIY